MKEVPQILNGLKVRDGWDRQEIVGKAYFVRTDRDPAKGIVTEWRRPTREEDIYSRRDTVIAVPTIQRVIGGRDIPSVNFVLEKEIQAIDRTHPNQQSENLRISSRHVFGERVAVKFRNEDENSRVPDIKFVYSENHDLEKVIVEVKGREVNYSTSIAEAEGDSLEENIAFLRGMHTVNLEKYAPTLAVLATLMPDDIYIETLSADSEPSIKEHFDEAVADDGSYIKNRLIDWTKEEKDKVIEEVGGFVESIAEEIFGEIEDDESGKMIANGLLNAIMKNVPSNLDLVTDPDARHIVLQLATTATIAELVGRHKFVTERSSDMIIDFQLDPEYSSVQLINPNSGIFYIFSETEYEMGQPFRYEGVTYIAEEIDGVVRISITNQSGNTIQVQAPRHIQVEKVKAQIVSPDNWVTTLDDLSIKSEQINKV